MKFITEDELRQNYKTKPFKTFILSEDNRLTPGAKQFLTDFRIKIILSKDESDEELELNNPKYELKNDSIQFNQELAIGLKRLSVKLLKFDPLKANKLNSFAIPLFMGIKLPDVKEIEKPKSLDKGIFLDIEGEHIETILDIMEFILKIEILEEDITIALKSKHSEGIAYLQRNMFIIQSVKYLLYRLWEDVLEKYGG